MKAEQEILPKFNALPNAAAVSELEVFDQFKPLIEDGTYKVSGCELEDGSVNVPVCEKFHYYTKFIEYIFQNGGLVYLTLTNK